MAVSSSPFVPCSFTSSNAKAIAGSKVKPLFCMKEVAMPSSCSSVSSKCTAAWESGGGSGTSTLVSSPLLVPACAAAYAYGHGYGYGYGSAHGYGCACGCDYDARYQRRSDRPRTPLWSRISDIWRSRRPSLLRRHLRLRSSSDNDVELEIVESSVHRPTITCTFCLDDDDDGAMYVRHIEYSVYRKWAHFADLLGLWEDELGVVWRWLWDEGEDMEVQAGDWEARVRPGWRICIVCEVHCGDWESDSDSGSDGGDGGESEDGDGWELEKGGGKREWWLLRWRERVERKKEGGGRGRGWVVGVVGLLGVGVAFWGVVFWAARG